MVGMDLFADADDANEDEKDEQRVSRTKLKRNVDGDARGKREEDRKKKKDKKKDKKGKDEEEGQQSFRVNEEYAKRFQHNKEREELQRLIEKHGDLPILGMDERRNGQRSEHEVDDESDDESDDVEDDDGILPGEQESEFFEVLAKIRRKDPAVFDSDATFFTQPTDDELVRMQDERRRAARENGENAKPMKLKEVLAQQILTANGAEDNEDDEDEDRRQRDEREGLRAKSRSALLYNEEQRELKKEFGVAVRADGSDGEDDEKADGEEGGGIFSVKSRGKVDPHGGAGERSAIDMQKSLEDYFGKDKKQTESERFLRKYLMNQGWRDDEGDDDEEEDGDFEEEDEEEFERAEDFEHAYNFRYEEPGGLELATFSRRQALEQTVRKDPKRESRKRAREARKDRLLDQRRVADEEIKRLKNLKLKELQNKIERISEVAGARDDEVDVDAALLEGDWDPDAYDKRMQELFSEDYYETEDPESGKLIEAAQVQEIERIDEDDGDKDSGAKTRTFRDAQHKALRKQRRRGLDNSLLQHAESADGSVAVQLDAAGDLPMNPPSNLSSSAKKAYTKALDEYFKLDYEGMAGGQPTRFKYTNVRSDTFGLEPWQILLMDDKELNQVVSLKKLAAFRDADAAPWDEEHDAGTVAPLKRKKKAGDGRPGPRDVEEMRSRLGDKRSRKETFDRASGKSKKKKKKKHDSKE